MPEAGEVHRRVTAQVSAVATDHHHTYLAERCARHATGIPSILPVCVWLDIPGHVAILLRINSVERASERIAVLAKSGA